MFQAWKINCEVFWSQSTVMWYTFPEFCTSGTLLLCSNLLTWDVLPVSNLPEIDSKRLFSHSYNLCTKLSSTTPYMQNTAIVSSSECSVVRFGFDLLIRASLAASQSLTNREKLFQAHIWIESGLIKPAFWTSTQSPLLESTLLCDVVY